MDKSVENKEVAHISEAHKDALLLRTEVQLTRVASNNESKAYRCRACGDGFSSLLPLMKHNKNHNQQENYYKCPICDLHFDSLDYTAYRHLRVHSREKIYKCSKCGTVESVGHDFYTT